MYVFDFVPAADDAPEYSPEGEIVTEQDGSVKMVSTESPYEGKLVVKAPSQMERLQYSKEVTLSVSQDGVLSHKTDQLEMTMKMFEIAKKHILEVDLKRRDNGFEIKDLEAFEHDADSSMVMTQIASRVLKGVRLGNDVRKRSDAK